MINQGVRVLENSEKEIQGVRVLEPRPSILSHHYGNGVALCYAYQELLFRNIQVL